MAQEDKKLLLVDLSARLSYGVKVQHQHEYYLDEIQTIEHISRQYGEIETESVLGFVDDFKPYLRSMSSMTEEEKDEMFGICTLSDCSVNSNWESVGVEIMSSNPRYGDHYSTDYKVIDWLNAHHFDYRGLIEKGLAIEVTEENNPYKSI